MSKKRSLFFTVSRLTEVAIRFVLIVDNRHNEDPLEPRARLRLNTLRSSGPDYWLMLQNAHSSASEVDTSELRAAAIAAAGPAPWPTRVFRSRSPVVLLPAV